MKHSEGYFTGKGNLRIYRQSWIPERPRATVVLVHGLGEHSGRYQEVAERLVEVGCAVYALDHRGHGRSEGPRALIDRFSNAVADIDQLVAVAQREQRGRTAPRPTILLGHSMGGALALSYALQHASKLSALVLSGPAVALDGASALMRCASKALSRIAPRLGVLAVDPSLVSRDPKTVENYAADPLNAHGKIPARTIGEIVVFVEGLPPHLPSLGLPLLVMHGGDDKLAGVSGSRMVVERCTSADKTLLIYDHLFHEIFNELPDDRQRVFADLTRWVGDHLGA